MAGEATILDLPFDNVALSNVQPYQIVQVDAANSGNQTTAARLPASATQVQPLGVVYDKAKLDPLGNVVAGSGMNVRVLGVARVVADGAVTPGGMVGHSTTTVGQAHQFSQTAGGSQPKPILGMALSQAAATGDRILVLLTPGVQW